MPNTPYKSTQWRKLRPVIYDRDGGRCQLCGEVVTLESYDIDHIIPWLDGGPWFDQTNLRLTCPNCNRGRNNQRLALQAKINRATPTEPSRRWR